MSVFRTGLKTPFRLTLARSFQVGKSPRRDEILQVPIESLDKEGNGVTTIEWTTIQKQIEPTRLVVRGALPGETVRVRVVSVFAKGGSAIHTVRLNVFGRREYLIRPRTDNEPWRSTIEPELLPAGHKESDHYQFFDCPHFSRRHDEEACRGCSVPHLNYTRQVIEKSKLLRESLRGAVDDHILAGLTVEPRSQITHFSDKSEIFAFSKRPLEVPVWGQLSYQNPLPGERRNKHFVPTPECRILQKPAKAILNRMSELVALAHSESPGLFSVHDEILERGYLRSVIIQTAKNREGEHQALLSFVTARAPSRNFQEKLTSDIAERLMQEFPILKGVLLVEARPSTNRDDEFLADRKKMHVISGQGSIPTYIESVDREIYIGPSSKNFDKEVSNKLISTLTEAVGSDDGRLIELFGNDGSITGVLREISPEVKSLSEREIALMLNEGIAPDVLQGTPMVPAIEAPLDPVPLVRNESNSVTSVPSEDIRETAPTVVISFPTNNNAKPDVKGVTSKDFRHWLGNVVKPRRIVLMTDKFDGLRKDIGHMRMLGYELKSIRAIDAQPGRMDKIASIVVMDKKPQYEKVIQDPLIE